MKTLSSCSYSQPLVTLVSSWLFFPSRLHLHSRLLFSPLSLTVAARQPSLSGPMSDYGLFVLSRLRVIDGPRGPGRSERSSDESVVISREMGVKRRNIQDIISLPVERLCSPLLYRSEIFSFSSIIASGYFQHLPRATTTAITTTTTTTTTTTIAAATSGS